MPVTLSVEFPFGQYHATAWERDHNEGEVEWPPSPWRILRSLVAAWHITAPDLSAGAVATAISKIQDPPHFHLPQMRPSHTRHYFPSRNNRSDAPGKNRDMVFDAFANFDPARSFIIYWPETELDEQDRLVLKRLAAGVRYLGRAESPCDISLVDDFAADGLEEWLPVDGVPHALTDVPLLVCRSEHSLRDLGVTTHGARKKGLRIPDGSVQITYRRSNAQEHTTTAAHLSSNDINVVVWALTGKGKPNLKQTLAVTESLRGAALHKFGGGTDCRSQFLSGRATDNSRLIDARHGHAHYLALSSDGTLIDRVAIWSPAGFPDTAEEEGRRLVTSLSRLGWLTPGRGGKSFPDQSLALLGIGPALLLGEYGAKSTSFTSASPYVPTRYAKSGVDQVDHIRNNVRDELASRGYPPASSIEPRTGGFVGWRRSRPRRSDLGSGPMAVEIRVEFECKVRGPILIGKFSHFGFGLLKPDNT